MFFYQRNVIVTILQNLKTTLNTWNVLGKQIQQKVVATVWTRKQKTFVLHYFWTQHVVNPSVIALQLYYVVETFHTV